ncbi:hypothetical protein ACQKWADRAFT_195007 [Trichoderma austrokoningii]
MANLPCICSFGVAFATDAWASLVLWPLTLLRCCGFKPLRQPCAMLGETGTRTAAAGCNATAQFHYCMQLPKVSGEYSSSMRHDS